MSAPRPRRSQKKRRQPDQAPPTFLRRGLPRGAIGFVFELLFIVALVAWAATSLLQYLAALPAAPTLLAAALLLPLLGAWRTRVLARRAGIGFVCTGRRPLPPERFYWPAARRRLGRRIAFCTGLAAVAVPAALVWPARWSAEASSLAGWAAAAVGIATLAEAAAGTWLYVRASQRFDHLAPVAVGWLRRGLYRLSDNHEFLGEEPLPRQKHVRESVY